MSATAKRAATCLFLLVHAKPSHAEPATSLSAPPRDVPRGAEAPVTKRAARHHDSLFGRISMLGARMWWRGDRHQRPPAEATEWPRRSPTRPDAASGGLSAELAMGIPIGSSFALGPLLGSELYPDSDSGGVRLVHLGGFAQLRPLPTQGFRTSLGAARTTLTRGWPLDSMHGLGVRSELAYDWWLGEHWSAAAVLRFGGVHLTAPGTSATVSSVGLGFALSME